MTCSELNEEMGDKCPLSHIPNAETIEALEEAKNPENLCGPYNPFEEMLEDALRD
jgi:hypothetical protein